MSRNLKALIFDVGDILYDASVWRKWIVSELNRYGLHFTFDQFVALWEEHLIQVYRGNVEYWPEFDAMVDSLEISAEQKTELKQGARDQGKLVQVDRRPMPQVPETLAQLQALGIRLVALSDNESGESGLRKTLMQLGIESYFYAVVSSFDIGFVKPEAEAFDYAISASGVAKEHCGFVAHDIDELEGAQRHALYAIGFNYHPAAPADIYIERFEQLLDIVG